jgi:hypothetical protein
MVRHYSFEFAGFNGFVCYFFGNQFKNEREEMKLKNSIAFFAAAICATLCASASAQKIYNPAQLREMVRSGSYPKQGPASSKTISTDYALCVSKVESIVGSVRANYPAQTIVSTSGLRVEKVWTNDAAMTFTCSAADKKLVITTASYL